MTCDFLERRFLAPSRSAELEAHLGLCESCRALARELALLDSVETPLRSPEVPAGLEERWKQARARTVDCDRAAELIAAGMDEPLDAPRAGRLEFHLSRCPACAEAAEILDSVAFLRPPETAIRSPLPGRSRVVPIEPRRAGRSSPAWSDPRLYAAAACILAGFLALFSDTLRSSPTVRAAAAATERAWSGVTLRASRAADAVGAFNDEVSRKILATREALSGYGKAARAIALSAAGRATEGFFRTETRVEKGSKS
jgi:hypothetical protein